MPSLACVSILVKLGRILQTHVLLQAVEVLARIHFGLDWLICSHEPRDAHLAALTLALRRSMLSNLVNASLYNDGRSLEPDAHLIINSKPWNDISLKRSISCHFNK